MPNSSPARCSLGAATECSQQVAWMQPLGWEDKRFSAHIRRDGASSLPTFLPMSAQIQASGSKGHRQATLRQINRRDASKR